MKKYSKLCIKVLLGAWHESAVILHRHILCTYTHGLSRMLSSLYTTISLSLPLLNRAAHTLPINTSTDLKELLMPFSVFSSPCYVKEVLLCSFVLDCMTQCHCPQKTLSNIGFLNTDLLVTHRSRLTAGSRWCT
jgi:hypothetical protein